MPRDDAIIFSGLIGKLDVNALAMVHMSFDIVRL